MLHIDEEYVRARSRILKRLAHAAKRSSGASSRRSRSPVAASHSQTSTPSPLGGDAARIWKKEGTVFLTQRGPSILMPRTLSARVAKHIAIRWSWYVATVAPPREAAAVGAMERVSVATSSSTLALHLRSSSLSAATRSHSCLRSTPSEAKVCGCEASGAMAIAVITESPKSVGACREMTRGASFARLAGSAAAPPSPSPPPLLPSAAAVGAKRGNSASICQPVPPSLFGGWQASTRTGRWSGKSAFAA
mmetsp:Transcript_29637/g.94828  ORF Transcript_29637/g.94828 Transcript_29637/m.94828 type:complete len:249 (+) Transcript_29637:186-932(+)